MPRYIKLGINARSKTSKCGTSTAILIFVITFSKIVKCITYSIYSHSHIYTKNKLYVVKMLNKNMWWIAQKRYVYNVAEHKYLHNYWGKWFNYVIKGIDHNIKHIKLSVIKIKKIQKTFKKQGI